MPSGGVHPISFGRAAAEDCDELRTFDLTHCRILLRENPDRPEWAPVLDEIARLRLYAFVTPAAGNVERGCERVVDLSRRRLKDEWNRVRAGERSFRIIKWLLPAALGTAAAALAYGHGFIVLG